MSFILPGRIGLALAAQIRRLPHIARLALAVLLVSAGYYAGGFIGLSVGFPPSGKTGERSRFA